MAADPSRAAADAAPDASDAQRAGEVAVEASQLRPGVHVRLTGGWMDHPFLRSSFVIADDQQVRQIAALPRRPLYCDLSRCVVPPLPRSKVVAEPSAEEARQRAESSAEVARQLADKQAREAAMQKLRARLEAAHHHYTHAAQVVGAALRGFEASPIESASRLAEVSAASAAVLTRDAESAVALIAEKGHADIGYAHALSVMTLALLLGRQAGLAEPALKDLGVGALLHDIGKAALDASVLKRPRRSRFEDAIYRSHCRAGHAIAQRGAVPAAALQAVLHHHERTDGSGWPDALAGSAIPLPARIVAIANRFDNLVNPPDPRRALTPSEALATLWSKERAAFDPTLLQLFVRAMGVYPPGSLVLLSDGRPGVVVASATAADPLRPQVLVYDPGVPRRHAIIVALADEPRLKIECSLAVHERGADEIEYLLPRRKLSWLHVGRE